MVSLIVGVGSGLLINFLTEKRAKLTYDVTTQEVFPGEQNNIGIFALRIGNDGKREIEQVLCHLRFPEGKITERRIAGIPESARVLGGSGNEIEVVVPFLNPGEQFSIQALLGEVKQPLGRPSIEVRGKGVLGTEAQPEKSSRGSLPQFLSLAIAVTATLLTALTTLTTRIIRRGPLQTLINPSRHSADQRDTVAFALEAKGLPEDAKDIRSWPRDLTYWAASDALCNKWIRAGDPGQVRNGIEALDLLLDYVSISDDSRRIVMLNLSRLSISAGDRDLAMKYFAAARDKNDRIVEKRIKADAGLLALAKEHAV
ncbi:MAG: hypothetical protein ACHQ9S_17080 [Candidatus Binatia bacterium]